ncbi:MAG: hypothetical protein U0441_24750 [Polyangiaceae bacterium]
MSDPVEEDEEGATQMMTSRSLVGDATKDALDEEEGDLTVPFDRGVQFAQLAPQRPRPAAGMPAPRQAPMHAQTPRIAPHVAAPVSPVVVEADPDLGETGQMTVPVVRGDLPLPSVHEFGDTGEQTVPRQLAPKAPSQLAPSQLAPSQLAPSQRQAPQYNLPPPAYRPPAPGSAPPAQPLSANEPTRPARRPGSMPPPDPFAAQPRFQGPPPPMQPSPPMPTPQVPATLHVPSAPQMPNPIPQSAVATLPRSMALVPPTSAPAPSVRAPSPPTKMRSPPVFVAVMVACTVLTITGLLLLVYLKLRHFW